MFVDDVRIIEEWQTRSHAVYVLVRAYAGAPRGVLASDGQTVQPITEGYAVHADGSPARGAIEATVRLPEGVLDKLVQVYSGQATAPPATERHLDDATKTRDRLLGLVERLTQPPTIVTGAETVYVGGEPS